ncbi:MAG: nitroreductase [Anaerolineae bacterium]|nr:nitroreductase [Anaerolineae bacterium]
MSLTEIIKERRTIFNWLDKPVPVGLIKDLLDIAVWAPNHKMTEPWYFYLLTGEARRGWAEIHGEFAREGVSRETDDPERIQRAADKTFRHHMDIPAYLVVVQRLHKQEFVRWEDHEACVALIQNFLLLAHEQGLGTLWESPFHEERLYTYLGLQPDDRIVAYIHIGYPARIPKADERTPGRARLVHMDVKKTPDGFSSFGEFLKMEKPLRVQYNWSTSP